MLGPGLVALAAFGGSTPAAGADSLATPITSELRQSLWPVEIRVEIVAVSDVPSDAAEAAEPGSESESGEPGDPMIVRDALGTPTPTPSIQDAPDALVSTEPMPVRAVVVPDGNRVSFASAIWTPRGRRDFAIDVVAHHHPRGQMEIEWDLVVEDAPYQTVSIGSYLLHRLRFGPRPDVGPERVRVSRADIVSTRGEPHVEVVEIDGQNYEVRIVASSVRG